MTMSATLAAPPQLPPSYSSDLIDFPRLPRPTQDAAQALPAYTRRQPQGSGIVAHSQASATSRAARLKDYTYDIKKKNKVFAAMTLAADGGLSKTMATFWEGQPVKGRVRLCLDKPDGIQSIVVNVVGQVITGANQGEQLTFIDVPLTVWSHAMGDPRNVATTYHHPSAIASSSTPPANGDTAAAGSPPESPPIRDEKSHSAPGSRPDSRGSGSGSTPANTNPVQKFVGKIPEGEYFWDFAIDLPKEVVLPNGLKGEVQPQIFCPPQTFNERHTRASVVYEASVKFLRNSILRGDHKVQAQFGYIPMTYPPPFPPLRALAYQDATPLLGPVIDPQGWHVLEPARMKGRIFNNRSVVVECTLFLAKPLSYTRGTVIPLCLQLTSDDPQALDLLSSPKAIVCRLRRRIKCHPNAEKAFESMAWRDAIDHSQLAVWWHDRDAAGGDGSGVGASGSTRGRRFVNGELHLRYDMKPSSAMAHFKIEYSVVLQPFDTAGFEPSGEVEQIAEQPVEVVTAFAPGPRPRLSAPPGYETDASLVQAGRTDVGYLQLVNNGYVYGNETFGM